MGSSVFGSEMTGGGRATMKEMAAPELEIDQSVLQQSLVCII